MIDLVIRREEATDPTALPAGVSHEAGIVETQGQSGPLLAPRVLVMTPGLHPAAGGGAGLLHEVEHLLAVHLTIIQSFVVKAESCVELTGSVSPPLGAVLRLVLHSSRSATPASYVRVKKTFAFGIFPIHD